VITPALSQIKSLIVPDYPLCLNHLRCYSNSPPLLRAPVSVPFWVRFQHHSNGLPLSYLIDRILYQATLPSPHTQNNDMASDDSQGQFPRIRILAASDDYQMWALAIKSTAMRNGYWDLIYGSSTRPDLAATDASSEEKRWARTDREKWDKDDQKAQGLIRCTVSQDLQVMLDEHRPLISPANPTADPPTEDLTAELS